MTSPCRAIALCLFMTAAPALAAAQNGTATPPPQTAAGEQPDPDLQLVPGEPDFTLGALPTALRMPAGKFAFRLTHRFSRPIAAGSVGDFFADFFGFDSSSRVGFEVRYGIRPGTQLTVHRTNNRDLQFYGQHEVLAQTDTRPFGVNLIGAVEGTDNFSEDFSGSLGAVVSHRFGDRGAVYAQPVIVFNANEFDLAGTDDHTVMLGLGARIRIGLSRAYVVVEAAPRLDGFAPAVDHVSVGIEQRAGGHVFQLTVTNSFATTLRQMARGGITNDDWFIGFNLTRRFF